MTTESLETRTEDGDFKFIFNTLGANSLQRRHYSFPSILPSRLGNGNLLVAQRATLAQTATVESLSFYVKTASGKYGLTSLTQQAPMGARERRKPKLLKSPLPSVGTRQMSLLQSPCLKGHTGSHTSRATTIWHLSRICPGRVDITRTPMDRCQRHFPHRLKARSFTGLCSQLSPRRAFRSLRTN